MQVPPYQHIFAAAASEQGSNPNLYMWVKISILPLARCIMVTVGFYHNALSELLALVFRIIVNMKKSVTYCQQVLFIVKVFCVHSVHCTVC